MRSFEFSMQRQQSSGNSDDTSVCGDVLQSGRSSSDSIEHEQNEPASVFEKKTYLHKTHSAQTDIRNAWCPEVCAPRINSIFNGLCVNRGNRHRHRRRRRLFICCFSKLHTRVRDLATFKIIIMGLILVCTLWFYALLPFRLSFHTGWGKKALDLSTGTK